MLTLPASRPIHLDRCSPLKVCKTSNNCRSTAIASDHSVSSLTASVPRITKTNIMYIPIGCRKHVSVQHTPGCCVADRTFTSFTSNTSTYKSSRRSSAIASATSNPAQPESASLLVYGSSAACLHPKGHLHACHADPARLLEPATAALDMHSRQKAIRQEFNAPRMKAWTKSAAFCTLPESGVSGLVFSSTCSATSAIQLYTACVACADRQEPWG